MDDKQRDPFVDELVDASLARYAKVEPQPGLEARVLAGLRDASRTSPWREWGWAAALAAVAIVVTVAAVFIFRQSPSDVLPPELAKAPARATPTAARAGREAERAPRAPKATLRRAAPSVEMVKREAPRLDTFPAPTPLSEQERLLLLFTREAPAEAVLVAQSRSRPTQPLAIAPLPPIEELTKKTEVNN
jgi:hypothetical protein